MDVNIAFFLLSALVVLFTLPDGIEVKAIRNCRKFFHKLQKRSLDGYHLLEGYELSPSGERRDNDCNVYELTPPPSTALPLDLPHSWVYYVYPMVVDVAGHKIYSAVNFQDLRETSQGTQIQSGGSAQSGCLPGPGSSQPGEDLSFLTSLLAEGKGSYVPPMVVSGKDYLQLPISKMIKGAVLSHGFAKEVMIAKPGDAVHLPNGYSFWPVNERNQDQREANRDMVLIRL